MCWSHEVTLDIKLRGRSLIFIVCIWWISFSTFKIEKKKQQRRPLATPVVAHKATQPHPLIIDHDNSRASYVPQVLQLHNIRQLGAGPWASASQMAFSWKACGVVPLLFSILLWSSLSHHMLFFPWCLHYGQ